MRRVLKFVRTQMAMLPTTTTPYGDGYLQALADVEEFIEDSFWQEGEDVSE